MCDNIFLHVFGIIGAVTHFLIIIITVISGGVYSWKYVLRLIPWNHGYR